MLRITDSRNTHSRRDFLRIGGLGLGGLTLPQLLAVKAAADDAGIALRDKAVVFLFMHGGPPQAELFDPKMTAPSGIRSVTGETRTPIPGVTFGGTMHQLAPLADKFNVVRSFATGSGNHDIKPIVSKETLNANLGSLYARVAGGSDPVTGMPRNAALFPRSVRDDAKPRITNFGKFSSTGDIGPAYAPFIPGGKSNLQSDMTLHLSRQRIDDRRALLKRVDQLRRDVDKSGTLDGVDKFQAQAFDTIVSGVADAFDISKEDPRTIARYDTEPIISPDRISRKWNNYSKYVDHVQTLGKLMLLARRLVERGAGFVTVTTSFVWDFHADRNNATVDEGMRYVAAPFDKAVSAFIEDCEARGLGDKVLLVCCGEMGRTPKVNKNGGRDHWGRLAPLMLYGGGLQGGQVIGQSDAQAGAPATDPVTNEHLVATIMQTLFDIGELRLVQGVPQDILRVATHEGIKGLV